jgi:hypothetical protein
VRPCKEEGCERDGRSTGQCKTHYNRDHKRAVRNKIIEVGDFCKKGHKIAEGNAQFYLNHGIQRVRCKTCNETPNNRFKVGSVCGNGHTIEGENIFRQMRAGSEYIRCRICQVERNARKNATYKFSDAGIQARIRADANRALKRTSRSEQSIRADELLKLEAAGTAGKFTSLNYLRLTKRAARAHVPLEQAYDRSKSRCYKNPTDYIDYDEELPPTTLMAERMCHGCPMLVECARFANAYQPVVGVWGGSVWKDGKILIVEKEKA